MTFVRELKPFTNHIDVTALFYFWRVKETFFKLILRKAASDRFSMNGGYIHKPFSM